MCSPFSLELCPHCMGWCRAWCQGGRFCRSPIHDLGFEPSSCLGVASLVAQMVKNLPSMQETWVQSLAGEDPLEKEMATPSSVLDRRTPWTEETGGLQSVGSQRIRQDWVTNTSPFSTCLGGRTPGRLSVFACACLCAQCACVCE